MSNYYNQQPSASGPPAKRPRGDNRLCNQDDVIVLKEKVMIPVAKFPGYNFVGSIIGPGGSILKELQLEVNAKIAIFGQGSLRDKEKEKSLFDSGEEKYQHFKEPLHVLIDIKAPRADAHRRMSVALRRVYTFMDPNAQEQDQGQQFYQGPPGPPPQFDGGYGGGGGRGGGFGFGGPPRGGFGGPPRGGRGAPGGGRGGPRGGRGGPRGAPRGGY